MKFGFRMPSLKKRIAARTSWKRIVRSKVRVPKGMGVVTNPKKFLYNKIYNKTTFGVEDLLKTGNSSQSQTTPSNHIQANLAVKEDGTVDCPRCGTNMGKPQTRGLFVKHLFLGCPNCGLTAKAKATNTNSTPN